ncbi:Dcp1p-Dcp2p decapping enzyme complex alpha subunit [Coemansia nantahalensis]|uniref:Dcp1p-Dcp2p decapping enzyme complex alpha subunit n=1 Tax=Coemansia nantahalensis TaxID=2789366 RepID=A0ACC1JND7_9FUNG|nr:Dcp1p-Dcp2p decapping enzyme complex alpha subunit [Coemansia nantahalensis]KAJ2773138.1 Dcp1p-Dcp2p decapping enzyme complex alpha subunit [Coemansia nantahalensis]
MAGDIPSIPGEAVPEYAAQGLRQLVADLVQSGRTTFPGAQPVSFTRKQSLPELLGEDYFVCEKSDGVRVLVLMLVDRGYRGAPLTYVITRKNEYYLVPDARFPRPDAAADGSGCPYHHLTLIDAELVVVEEDGRPVRRLLGFDALAVNGQNCMAKPFTSRLGYLKDRVVAPYARMCAQLPAGTSVPFTAEVKQFQYSYAADYVHTTIIPALKHGSDGLIFTSVNSPYVIGTSDKIIKWKPANENSIDFKARAVGPDEVMLMIWRGGDSYSDYAPLGIAPEDRSAIFPDGRPVDGRIIEAAYDPEHCPPAKWRFLRFREDKTHGNHASVVTRILDSINDSVDLADLFATCVQIKDRWKQRNGES